MSLWLRALAKRFHLPKFVYKYIVEYYYHPFAWHGAHGLRRHLMWHPDVELPNRKQIVRPEGFRAYLAVDYLKEMFQGGLQD